MDHTAVQKIADLAGGRVLDVDELKYSDKPVHLIKPPIPTAIGVITLTGLIDLIAANVEGFKENEEMVVHVQEPASVTLKALESDPYGQRNIYVTAAAGYGESGHPFGQFLDQEAFVIWISSRFVQDANTEDLLKMASNLTAENVAVGTDDGIAQQVAVKAGAHLAESITVRRRIVLSPYRTFREIEQPASDFIVRLRNRGDGTIPQIALFEADGGKWKLDAVLAIKDYLDEKIDVCKVIA